jgi:uncharacterized surface protein with fasciclin (FAS1) repeats
MKNIVEIAMEAGNFKTLVTAVKAAGLVEVLSGPGPFTVFAPTDEAFSKLPKGTVEALLKDIPKLKAILTYHVVQGKYMSSQVMELLKQNKEVKVNTVQGAPITLSLKGTMRKTLHVNDAQVIKADIEASNGVIHVIDKVILPP